MKMTRNSFNEIEAPKLVYDKKGNKKSVHQIMTEIQDKLQRVIEEKKYEDSLYDDDGKYFDEIFESINSQHLLEKMDNFSFLSQCNCKTDFDICKTPFILQLKNCKNYNRFIRINPIVELIFEEDKIISFNKQQNFFSNESYEEISSNFSNLNDFTSLYKDIEEIRVIFSTALYEFSMKNLFFIRAQPREAIIDIFTILAYMQEPEYITFFKKHNINPNYWVTSFSSILMPSSYVNAKEVNAECDVEKIMDILIENNYNVSTSSLKSWEFNFL